MKFYRFIAAFLFFKDKKLNTLIVALKFLTVVSLNLMFFASFIFLSLSIA